MYVLGIHDGHLATAALAKDGEIIACVSEERFTGIKNQAGIPINSIAYCLSFANIKYNQIDLVVFAGELLPPTISGQGKKSFTANFYSIGKTCLFLMRRASIYLPILRSLEDLLYGMLLKPSAFISQKQRKTQLLKSFAFDRKKITFLNHHLSHAYSGLFSSGFTEKNNKLLILTADGEGDGLSTTVNIFKNGKLSTISKTSMTNSLGNLYRSVTKYLGMKPLEHEYKIMGLAAYVSEKDEKYIQLYSEVKDLVKVNLEKLKIITKVNSQLFKFSNYLEKYFHEKRFDHIAASCQKLTEEVLTCWINASIRKTGIKDIILSGGVFMNVKANQKIAMLDQVNSIFVMPSCSDESNAIGAAYWGSSLMKRQPKPLGNLYLGPGFTAKEAEKAINSHPKKNFWSVKRPKNINLEIAKLLAEGDIIARCNGRQEWGARALGNRSILADPSKPEVVEIINKMIKSRDFWMPFACTILDKYESRYIKNPKKINAPYMITTFDTTDTGKKDLKSAIHPYDKTARPQILKKETNPDYYEIIEKFGKLTGIFGILNTSFNLHGFPIVSDPQDALETFSRSGLKYLVLGRYLIEKK